MYWDPSALPVGLTTEVVHNVVADVGTFTPKSWKNAYSFVIFNCFNLGSFTFSAKSNCLKSKDLQYSVTFNCFNLRAVTFSGESNGQLGTKFP